MAGKPNTPRTQAVLEAIQTYISEHGISPTIRDIQEICDISSTSVVTYHINLLKEQGKLTSSFGKSRSFVVQKYDVESDLVRELIKRAHEVVRFAEYAAKRSPLVEAIGELHAALDDLN